MGEVGYELHSIEGGVPVKSWTRGIPVEASAIEQVKNIASLPFIHSHVALMPDVHFGIGATIGSVIPTVGAIIPAAVGVDIGCGMSAVQTSLTASDLPDNLHDLRHDIERGVPAGRREWRKPPAETYKMWKENASLVTGLDKVLDSMRSKGFTKRMHRASQKALYQLGTLGGGNHFVEICLDESQRVWAMLHSGSRGIGNALGTHFIDVAKQDMRRHIVNLPDENLAYLTEGSDIFDDYVMAVSWAQQYAWANRELMMMHVLKSLRHRIKPFDKTMLVVDCHHNYVQKERHFGEDVWLTRKGAVRARKDDLGIIPGSMGDRSFIVRGKGCVDSFESCSHGAGRIMSRTEARKRFTLEDHERDTTGVECRKDKAVIDETPKAYKDIDAVMKAQGDLVEIVHTLKQVVCVKG